jgi:ABC-type glycerol-3-phosphate transport system substrate-binding protein
MADRMRALVYERPQEMNMREVERPEPEPGEVLIRVEATGICGSELSGYLGQNSLRQPPDAAWNFAKYLIQSKESIQQYQIPYGVLPALKPDLQGNEAFSDPVSQTYIDDIFPTMVGGPYGPNYGEAANFIIQAMQQAALENTPIDQILKQTQQNLETVYAS